MIKFRHHSRKGVLLVSVLVSGILSFSGCLFRTTIPIPMLEYGLMDASENKNLLILLRGIGGNPEDFDKHSLIQEVRSRNLPFDIVVPNAHFGYYRSKTLEERLREDVIEPARMKGYRRIWLAGFSMGGLGSLFYLRSFKEDVDGVILSSPFMGWDTILNQIDSVGGIEQWTPKKNSDNWQQLIWTWVKQYRQSPESYPPIYLGFGMNDTITGKGPTLLRAALPEKNVFTVPGGHTYKTFKRIWKIHLDRLEHRFKALPR